MRKKQNITIQDVANEAKVSKTTVSRYLNGRYEYMSLDTRNRIEKTIKIMGFRPNKIANSLKTNRSGLIGLVLSNASSTLTPFLMSGICDELSKKNYNVIVVNTNLDEKEEIEQVDTLLDHRVEGLVVGSGLNLKTYEEINESGIPVVLVDRVPKQCSLDSVTINHWEATTHIINNMIDNKYNRIGLITYDDISEASTLHIRIKAAKEVFVKRFGNDERCAFLPVRPGCDEDITKKIQDFNGQYQNESKALFVVNAQLLPRVAYTMINLGIEISSKFGLSGYDIWNIGDLISPRIFTIHQPLEEMGVEAAKLLISRINDNKEVFPINKVLHCKCFPEV